MQVTALMSSSQDGPPLRLNLLKAFQLCFCLVSLVCRTEPRLLHLWPRTLGGTRDALLASIDVQGYPHPLTELADQSWTSLHEQEEG